MRTRVLIIEDEPSISSFIRTMLESQGMSAVVADTGREAKMLFSSCVPDIVLLDLGLPDIDGTELVYHIREEAESNVPIIVVSARMQEAEKVKALYLGADDYITKPFGTDELLARIRTVLRRSKQYDNGQIYQSGELYVDVEHPKIMRGDEHIVLTNMEFRILRCLIRHAGKVVTHETICKEIWGPNCKENSALRVNIVNIRRKIEHTPSEPKYVFTEPGLGYRMAENEYQKVKNEKAP